VLTDFENVQVPSLALLQLLSSLHLSRSQEFEVAA
jgi:hypothetical protein